MRSYSEYLNGIFPGMKVQKISINAGFTCPNRDGTIGTGGCIYCRNDSFSPSYCDSSKSICQQIAAGKNFFARKYPEMKYLVYFQSYTGTYGVDPSNLEKMWNEALAQKDVVGLVISTRPDSLTDKTLEIMTRINKEKRVLVEIGAETANDQTLQVINRNHSWHDVETTVGRISDKGLHCGLHLIAGLPGEDEETILETVRKAASLPIETLKIHQLQILKDTILAHKWVNDEIKIKSFSLQEYLDLCVKIYQIVPEHIVIERFLSQSPSEMVISPKWGLKNYEFMNKLANLLKEHNL